MFGRVTNIHHNWCYCVCGRGGSLKQTKWFSFIGVSAIAFHFTVHLNKQQPHLHAHKHIVYQLISLSIEIYVTSSLAARLPLPHRYRVVNSTNWPCASSIQVKSIEHKLYYTDTVHEGPIKRNLSITYNLQVHCTVSETNRTTSYEWIVNNDTYDYSNNKNNKNNFTIHTFETRRFTNAGAFFLLSWFRL